MLHAAPDAVSRADAGVKQLLLSKTHLQQRHVCKCAVQGEELKRHVDATLGRGNVYEAVRLPEGEDIREWLAVNTVDLYNAVSVLYMTLQEYCTDETCKTMSAGHKVCAHREVC